MTFSLVVREQQPNETVQFGVGATTNNPGIGIFCPFVSENGAVATQYETHSDAAGGDGRSNEAGSAAIKIVEPEGPIANEWYNDLRVDASPDPLAQIESQYALAKSHHEENIDAE